VHLKLCTVNHLDTLARLRLEWKLLSEVPAPSSKVSHQSVSSMDYASSAGLNYRTATIASMATVVRPTAWDYLEGGGLTLVYPDEAGHLTVREAFLPDIRPHILGTSPDCSETAPTAKPRTQSDIIKILTVFSAVVNVLSVAHRSGITHNNINTFSIVVTDPASSSKIQGKLGGWHLASRLEREELGRSAGGAMLRGENPAPLQYIAPECTGRMNRSVDYRADFYSLGVALYELVVGFLPFRSSEPLELIHMHIAQPPKPPYEVNASIPQAVSDVVMKLLQKNAEDRYQTASGLKADLDLMIKLLSEDKSLNVVKIGELDTTSQFVITEKLYGREQAVATLLYAYQNCVKRGGCVMVTVQGSSGVGKSRLVNELQRPVVENKGFVFRIQVRFYSMSDLYLRQQLLHLREIRSVPAWLQLLYSCTDASRPYPAGAF
jgi:osomolarity two-component system sensor histidine kinase CHK1